MGKILFLVTQSEMGGAQRYIYEASKALTGRYEILVAAGSPSFVKTTAGKDNNELFKKLGDTGVKTRRLALMKRTPYPWQIFSAIKEIVDLLKKERPDVLFLCSTTAGLLGSIASFFYKLKAKDCKLKTIYRIGGWAFGDPRAGWKNKLIFWLEKITSRFKDLIVVNSQYDWRMAVERKIVSPEKIIKIYNGIDVDSLVFLSKEEARKSLLDRTVLADRSGGFLIGTVANFYKTKGLKYLIDAMHSSQLSTINCQLLIIGDGWLRPELEVLIKKYGLENKVILAGMISDASKYLKAFDIFILPSLKEGFPWVILEAMAAELPIVATDVGALTEIIDNNLNGCLVKPGNSRLLAEKIKWLLENPQEARVMGIQAKAKTVKKFSLQKMIEETKKLLNQP